MPQYAITVPLEEGLHIERFDGKPYLVRAERHEYRLAWVHPPRFQGTWLRIEPIDGENDRAAYFSAVRVLNSCLNELCALYDYVGTLSFGYLFSNLDDPRDRGAQDLVLTQEVGGGLPSFPDELKGDRGCRSASYFRRAQVELDPVEKCRFHCLAIEEAGKRIKVRYKDHKKGENRVVKDTIGRVFKKLSSIDRLKHLRSQIPDGFFTPSFRGGKNSAEDAMNDFLYQHVRCRVMHAGPTSQAGSDFTKETYAPFDPEARAKAQEVLPVVEEVATLYVRFDLGIEDPTAKKS
jgi:hypothetical protein